MIDAATTKLTTTAKVMEVTTENYQKASDKPVDIQIKMGEIQAELASLKVSDLNLVSAKRILIFCAQSPKKGPETKFCC